MGTMRVKKLTANDGRVFYSDLDLTEDDLKVLSKRMDGMFSAETVYMTPEEYRAIPASVDAAKVFGYQ